MALRETWAHILGVHSSILMVILSILSPCQPAQHGRWTHSRSVHTQHTYVAHTWCTVQGHPWRVVDAANGKTLQTYTATAGEQVLRIGIQATDVRDSPSKHRPADNPVSGFDGLGGTSNAYAAAQVCLCFSAAPSLHICTLSHKTVGRCAAQWGTGSSGPSGSGGLCTASLHVCRGS